MRTGFAEDQRPKPPMGAMLSGMRANLIWYIPLGVFVLFYLVIPNIVSGYHNIALVIRRFSWLLFLSPAAYLFFACVFLSIALPVQMTLFIPAVFDPQFPRYRRRYLVSFLIAAGIFAVCVVLQAVVWGSFPLPVDRDNHIHVRMIPFWPWPETPLFQ